MTTHVALSLCFGVLLVLHLATTVGSSCVDPSTCDREGDSCRALQQYIDCLNKQSSSCPADIKKRRDVSIKIIMQTHSKEPFNCDLTSGSPGGLSGGWLYLIFGVAAHIIHRV